jgi:hypothetical protein
LCGGWYHNELPGITDQHDPKEWGTPGKTLLYVCETFIIRFFRIVSEGAVSALGNVRV